MKSLLSKPVSLLLMVFALAAPFAITACGGAEDATVDEAAPEEVAPEGEAVEGEEPEAPAAE